MEVLAVLKDLISTNFILFVHLTLIVKDLLPNKNVDGSDTA
jgi:hypothetical protein